MGQIKSEDVRGCWVGEKVLCAECAARQNALGEVSQDQLILVADVESEEKLYYCDECGKSL